MSNDYPLVSIIIPTYNSSDYITETLTKLEKQTYPNFEIVIVNDGSKDNTSNVLREYGLTHSRLIIINKEKWRCFVCQEYRYPQGARTVYMFYG